MKVLGIDTSTRCGSVGLIDDDTIVAEMVVNTATTHAERLIGTIEVVLKESGLKKEDIDGWAVSIGPGSFTGLRIGLSTVKGLAYATGKPVAGVCTLDALASQIAQTPYQICPVIDARKKEVYTAFYRYMDGDNPTRVSPYRAVKPEVLIAEVRERTIFTGDGVETYGAMLLEKISEFAVIPMATVRIIHGTTIARLGLESILSKQHSDVSELAPFYIRPSEAEIKWGFVHEGRENTIDKSG